jgi:hypothetical protein
MNTDEYNDVTSFECLRSSFLVIICLIFSIFNWSASARAQVRGPVQQKKE